jgi:hypothetical protein
MSIVDYLCMPMKNLPQYTNFRHKWLLLSIMSFFFLLLLNTSCRKDLVSTNPSYTIGFSSDTVVFDTVFTSIGSVTKQLMVYNKNRERIRISSINLQGGINSAFRINVDGEAGAVVNDLEIAANDSAFIFVRVTVDPSDENNPFVVEDELRFLTNGNEQTIKLVAWGQNAVYILADQQIENFPPFKIIADSLQTTVWTSDKPYVVYGFALINSYGTLIIEEGTQVHFHDKSGLWAFADGVLKVKGSLENPVVFQGDRLDQPYRDVPGQWDRIWLMEGRTGFDHEIDYAIIRNGYIGIQAESFLRPTSNKLKINNTIIENHSGLGLFARLFDIEADNLVLANCGSYTAALTMGGHYRFRHSTFANNWSYSPRNNPSVSLSNYFFDANDNLVPVDFYFYAGNSIFYGSGLEEIQTDFVSGADTNYVFEHCLVKTTRNFADWPAFVNCLKNEDPLFVDYANFDFRPDSLSPVIDKGSLNIAAEVPQDILGIDRSQQPDLGAYEFVPTVNRFRK